MNKKCLLLLLLSFTMCFSSYAQDMDNVTLYELLSTLSDEIEGEHRLEQENVNWQFEIDSVKFICSSNTTLDRLRIVSPIISTESTAPGEMKRCLEANFLTAVDTKYAISEGYVWSVFSHPLKELSEERIIDAISQVYSGVKTFGTHYNCSLLRVPKAE